MRKHLGQSRRDSNVRSYNDNGATEIQKYTNADARSKIWEIQNVNVKSLLQHCICRWHERRKRYHFKKEVKNAQFVLNFVYLRWHAKGSQLVNPCNDP